MKSKVSKNYRLAQIIKRSLIQVEDEPNLTYEEAIMKLREL